MDFFEKPRMWYGSAKGMILLVNFLPRSFWIKSMRVLGREFSFGKVR